MSDHFGNINIAPPTPAKPASKPAGRPGKQRPGKRPARPKSAGKTRIALYCYVLAAVVLLPILYSIAGFWLVPLYVGKALPERLADKTGTRLTLSAVDFNPFTCTFSLQGLILRSSHAEPESPALLTIEKVVADLAPLSLLRNDLVSNALHIEGLDLTIIRTQDNHYNLEELLNTRGPGPSSDIIGFSELPFLFSLNNISIRESRVTFQDTPSAATHTLEQIELDLPTLSNFPFQADEYIHPRFSAVFNGSKIELTGQAALPGAEGKGSLETRLSCNIHALDLPLYSKYLPITLPLALTKGKADGRLQLNFSRGAEEGARIAIGFSGMLTEIEMADEQETTVVALPAITLEGTFLPMSGDLRFQKIGIRQPHFTAREPLAPEALMGLVPIPKNAATKTDEDKKSPSVDIDSLLVEDGDLTLSSKDTGKKPSTVWTSLKLGIKDFSTRRAAAQPAKKGSFDVSGEKSDSSMAFSWQGEFNDRNLPEGLLRLDNLPAATFFSGIGIGTVGSGTANLQGRLSLAIQNSKSGRGRLVADLTESEIDLRKLALMSDNSPWLEAPVVKLSGFSKKGSRIDFGGVRLEGGSLNLRSGKFPELFKGITAKDSRIALSSIDFSGKITILDKKDKPFALSSVLLQATDLQSKSETKETLIFSAKVNDKGLLKAKGTARLAPFQASLSTGFSGIEAKTLLPWFTELPLLTEAEAILSGKGVLTLPATSFSGQLRLDDASFAKEKNPLLSWKTADLQGFSYTAAPFHLGISLMDIDQPAMTWQRTAKDPSPGEQLSSLLQGLVPEKEKTASSAKESISISQLDIQEVRLKNGEIHYKDNRLSPPWAAEIREFGGQILALHSTLAKEQSRFSLSGQLNAIPFSLEGSADFFSDNPTGQSTFKTTGFPLSAFQPYLPSTLGIDGGRGVFALELSSTWKEKKLTHKARYLFNDIRPVSEEADSALPLALLKNPDRQVELQVAPVRRDQEDGTPILLDTVTAFQRQLIKAKVSPLLLASGDYTDLVGNEFAEFQPGSFILSDMGQKILSRFSSFLTAHPFVGIRVTGSADKLIDGNALKKQLEEVEAKRVDQENVRRRAAWQLERDRELERQRTQQQTAGGQGQTPPPASPPPTEYIPLFAEPVVIEESMYLDLARERATRVQALLTEKMGIAPARVVVSPEPVMTSDANNHGNRALIDLRAFTPPEDRQSAPRESPRQ